MRAGHDETPGFRQCVVAGLALDIRIRDRRLQRDRARRGRGLVGEIDPRTPEDRVQRRRLDDSRQPFDHGVRDEIFARHAGEGVWGERRLAGAGDELRALERDLEQMLFELVVVLEVGLLLSVLDLVQRGLRDVDVAALDQLRHLTVEEREQQRAYMRAVDVGVRHDNDAVIAKLVGVVFVLLLLAAGRAAEARAERGDQRDDFLRAHEFVETRALDVQDLAAQRQDRLELAIAPLLRRAAGEIAFDQVELAERRVALLAVRELARKAHRVQDALAPCQLPRLARGLARAGGIDNLPADDLGFDGILEQEFRELRRNDLLDDRLHFGGDELVLRLR